MSLSTSSKRPLNTSRDGDSTTSLGSLFQCLITLSVKKNFLMSIVESDEVSPQPPFLQAEQPQVPQPLPISLVLQTLPQPRCPSLDTLQPLNVSLGVRGPTLNTAFEVRPHQCRVQGTITALVLLATLLLIQARMPLAFLATWAHCWLIFSWLLTNTPTRAAEAGLQHQALRPTRHPGSAAPGAKGLVEGPRCHEERSLEQPRAEQQWHLSSSRYFLPTASLKDDGHQHTRWASRPGLRPPIRGSVTVAVT
ncbi:hypothetical protein QYF61_017132, partial [Mycteria americana]